MLLKLYSFTAHVNPTVHKSSELIVSTNTVWKMGWNHAAICWFLQLFEEQPDFNQKIKCTNYEGTKDTFQ